MAAYYNEFDPYAAQWLRNLISAGHIAPGDVDQRPIQEVKPDDIKNYTQCHFFAGIGGWSVALRLAGWGDDKPVWTGSCPCQPFSSAGRQKGKADERHLWPAWFSLIRELRPATVFGEQVESAIAHGWIDDVYHDMEAEGYAVGSAVLPACAVGKPHQRKRLWFVAQPAIDDDNGNAREFQGANEWQASQRPEGWIAESCGAGAVGNTESQRPPRRRDGEILSEPSSANTEHVADPDQPRSQGRELLPECGGERTSGTDGVEWLQCPDGKQRPVKSGICLLAHGVSARVGRLRAYGNAIVPAVAAEFIKAAMPK